MWEKNDASVCIGQLELSPTETGFNWIVSMDFRINGGEKTGFSINSNGSETDQWRLVLVLIPWNIEIFVRFTDDSGIQIIRNIWDGIGVTYDIVVLHTFPRSTHCRRMMNTKLFYYNGFRRTNEKHDTLWMKIIQTLD